MVEMSQSYKSELRGELGGCSAETLGAPGWWLGSGWIDRTMNLEVVEEPRLY